MYTVTKIILKYFVWVLLSSDFASHTGVKHLENCPAEPNIPVYLLVGGCFGLLKMLSLLWRQVRFRRYRKTGDVDTIVAIDDDNNGSTMTSKSYMYCLISIYSSYSLIYFFIQVVFQVTKNNSSLIRSSCVGKTIHFHNITSYWRLTFYLFIRSRCKF